MNRFDTTPYRRSTVGFDRLFDLMERQARNAGGDNYPPFNIERRGDDEYRITLAVAGFRPEDLDITAQQNLLVIQGRKRDDRDQAPDQARGDTEAGSAAPPAETGEGPGRRRGQARREEGREGGDDETAGLPLFGAEGKRE